MKVYTSKKKFNKIREKTVGVSELKKGLTAKQRQLVRDEKKYYQMVVALKKARQAQGLTQEELAKRAHLPRTTITKIESGSRNATLQTLMALAGAMGKQLEIRLA